MAKTTKNNTTVTETGVEVMNKEAVENLSRIEQIDIQMKDLLMKQEGIAITVGCLLWEVDSNAMYKELGYKSTAELAGDRYGIAKSTVSETLKVMKKFGSKKDGVYLLPDDYKRFGMSKLIKMTKLVIPSDYARAEITPEMSRDAIKDRIASYYELKDMFFTDGNLIEWVKKEFPEEELALNPIHTESYSYMVRVYEEYKKSLPDEKDDSSTDESKQEESSKQEEPSKQEDANKSQLPEKEVVFETRLDLNHTFEKVHGDFERLWHSLKKGSMDKVVMTVSKQDGVTVFVECMADRVQ